MIRRTVQPDLLHPGGQLRTEPFFAVRDALLAHLRDQLQPGVQSFDRRDVNLHGFRVTGLFGPPDVLEVGGRPLDDLIRDAQDRIQAVHIHRSLIDRPVQHERRIAVRILRDAEAQRRRNHPQFSPPQIDDEYARFPQPSLRNAFRHERRRHRVVHHQNPARFQRRRRFSGSLLSLLRPFRPARTRSGGRSASPHKPPPSARNSTPSTIISYCSPGYRIKFQSIAPCDEKIIIGAYIPHRRNFTAAVRLHMPVRHQHIRPPRMAERRYRVLNIPERLAVRPIGARTRRRPLAVGRVQTPARAA